MTETHVEIKDHPSSHPEASMTETPQTTANQKDDASWLISIMEDVDETTTNPSPGPEIPKVPVKLKEKCHDEWLPLAVSIGPHHYNDRESRLVKMEKLKYPMMRQFVMDCGKGKEAALYGEVKKLTPCIRKFYHEDIKKSFSDDAFARMMFIDGCFVLQFIHCVTGGYEDLKEKDPPEAFYEKLKTLSDQEVAHVKQDLFLLENQLPFPVLTTLMKERYKKEKGMERIDKFLPFRDQRRPFSTLSLILVLFLCCLCYVCCCCCCWAAPPTPPPIKKKDDQQPANPEDGQQSDQKYTHLLQLLYSKFTVSQKGPGTGKHKLSSGSRGHYLYYSAKDLKKVGIHFRPNGTGALTDVKLSSSIFCGKLKLPPITIDKSTKSMLLNLLAYESAVQVHCNVIPSYIHFMDSLIDDAEDVKELRSKGILFNYLGTDQEVAKLFNGMSESLDPETLSYYNDVKRDINKQCDSAFKKWVADSQHKYFSSPWSFIALIAAAFTIFLTAVATYVAVWPIK